MSLRSWLKELIRESIDESIKDLDNRNKRKEASLKFQKESSLKQINQELKNHRNLPYAINKILSDFEQNFHSKPIDIVTRGEFANNISEIIKYLNRIDTFIKEKNNDS